MKRPRAHVTLILFAVVACVWLTAGARPADEKTKAAEKAKVDEKTKVDEKSPASLEGKPAPEITQAAAEPPGGVYGEASPDLKNKIVVLFFLPDAKDDDSVAECQGFR